MMFAEQLLGARRSVLTWYLSHGVFTNITLLTIFLVPVGDGWHPWEPEGYRENRPTPLAGGCSGWSEFYNFTEYL